MQEKIRLCLSFSFLILFVMLVGCSSSPKEECPSVEQEPISACRAQIKCKQNKTSYGVGLGVGLGANLGLGMSQSQNTENYTKCIDQDLEKQKAQQQVIKE